MQKHCNLRCSYHLHQWYQCRQHRHSNYPSSFRILLETKHVCHQHISKLHWFHWKSQRVCPIHWPKRKIWKRGISYLTQLSESLFCLPIYQIIVNTWQYHFYRTNPTQPNHNKVYSWVFRRTKSNFLPNSTKNWGQSNQINPEQINLWKQKNAHLWAWKGTLGCQINQIDVNFHHQKKDKEWKVFPLMPIRVKLR